MDVSQSGRPLVSVILAVRNDATHLASCLGALAAQTYDPGRVELIVADGGSTDATPEILRTFGATAPFPVCIVANRRGNAAAGFNAGIRRSRGEVIVILGARALPEPSFLAASVCALEATGADAVGGVVTADGAGAQARAVALALGSPFGVGGARYRYATEGGAVDTVNYGAYRRAVFDRIGGFDEAMDNVEDDEFNYRLRAAGGRLYLCPEIRCRYRVRPSILALARQYARYGYPKIRVLRRHPRQMRPRQFAPAALVGALLFAGLAATCSPWARRLAGLLLGAYALASLAVSIRLASRHGWRYLPLLPAAFAALHLSYGAASLTGALRFLLLPSLLGRAEASEAPRFERPDPLGWKGEG
jgi:succinoglycan biosynthesis protein ExoA